MDEFGLADAFEEFASGREQTPQSATAAFWEFCGENEGQCLVGNNDLEKKVRGLLSSRGWQLRKDGSLGGEGADFSDNLDMVLNNA
jgi:hypothetical protein